MHCFYSAFFLANRSFEFTTMQTLQNPSALNHRFIAFATHALLAIAKWSLFVLPIVFAIVFLKAKYVLHYGETLRKLRIHHKALSNGPVRRYFENFFNERVNQSDQITGACTQCGNCCLEKQCVFLEPMDDDKFGCGIYSSPFRNLSNCGGFPISQEDITRYDCPGYVLTSKVIKIAVAQTS